MLTEEKKQELKQKYPKLYVTELDNGQQVIWHPINRSDYRSIVNDTDLTKSESELVLERQEQTCRSCVVYPEKEELDKLIAQYGGVATVISDEIYNKSGFAFKKKTQEL